MRDEKYDYEYGKNLATTSNIHSKTFVKINSMSMRILALEDRTKTLEKMIRLIEVRLNAKGEEKLNELRTIESNNAIINKLNKKIKYLENKLKDFETQKKICDEEYNKTIFSLKEKIQNLEEQLNINNDNEINLNNNKNSNNNKLIEEENIKIILSDFDEMIKNNNILMKELMDEKIYNANLDNENKINDLLNLIQDINKILEENENKINLINNNFKKYQNDNVNMIQMISVHEKKINNIDLLNDEIHELKIKINGLNSYLNDKNEEEKFTKEFLNSVRIK